MYKITNMLKTALLEYEEDISGILDLVIEASEEKYLKEEKALVEKGYTSIDITRDIVKELFLTITKTCTDIRQVYQALNNWKNGIVFVRDNVNTTDLPSGRIRGGTTTDSKIFPKGTLVFRINDAVIKDLLDETKNIENRINDYKALYHLLSHELVHIQQVLKAAINLLGNNKRGIDYIKSASSALERNKRIEEYFGNKHEIDAYANQCAEELLPNKLTVSEIISYLKDKSYYEKLKRISNTFFNYYDIFYDKVNNTDTLVFRDFVSSVVWFLEQKLKNGNK